MFGKEDRGNIGLVENFWEDKDKDYVEENIVLTASFTSKRLRVLFSAVMQRERLALMVSCSYFFKSFGS